MEETLKKLIEEYLELTKQTLLAGLPEWELQKLILIEKEIVRLKKNIR